MFRFPLEAATLTAHRFVLGATSQVFQVIICSILPPTGYWSDSEFMFHSLSQAQFFGGRFKEEEVEVVDATREVFGLFIDTLYGKRLDWGTLPLATVFGLFCLADKYLVNSLRTDILRVVRNREIDAKDLEAMLESADEAAWEHHGDFAEFLERSVVGRLEEVERSAGGLRRLVEQHPRYEAPVRLSEELAAIVGTDEMPRSQVGSTK